MANNLYRPLPSQTSDNQDLTAWGVSVLQYLKKLKTSSSSSDTKEDSPQVKETEVVQCSHSVDVLHNFRNIIIDVFMGYVIFQTHFLSAPPFSCAQKHKKKSAIDTSAPSASDKSAVAPTSKTPTDAAKPPSESNKQLQSIQGQHNLQPLVFFLFAGVRGLFMTPTDYQAASATDSMTLIEAMSFITEHSKTSPTPNEPIWKNLSAYLVVLFYPVSISRQNSPPCTITQLSLNCKSHHHGLSQPLEGQAAQ
jgi:hypothetical protein